MQEKQEEVKIHSQELQICSECKEEFSTSSSSTAGIVIQIDPASSMTGKDDVKEEPTEAKTKDGRTLHPPSSSIEKRGRALGSWL